MLVSHHHFDNETMMKSADKGYSLGSLWIFDTPGLPTALNQQAQGAQSTMPPYAHRYTALSASHKHCCENMQKPGNRLTVQCISFPNADLFV